MQLPRGAVCFPGCERLFVAAQQDPNNTPNMVWLNYNAAGDLPVALPVSYLASEKRVVGLWLPVAVSVKCPRPDLVFAR
jgi:hypothetical protein